MKNPAQRLGTKDGVWEVLAHPWFADLDQNKVFNKVLEPEFKPELSNDPTDVSHFDEALTGQEAILTVVNPSA